MKLRLVADRSANNAVTIAGCFLVKRGNYKIKCERGGVNRLNNELLFDLLVYRIIIPLADHERVRSQVFQTFTWNISSVPTDCLSFGQYSAFVVVVRYMPRPLEGVYAKCTVTIEPIKFTY